MSVTALANFLRILQHNQANDINYPVYLFQNASYNKLTGPEGGDYQFAPFIYQGAAQAKTGDNIESTLVLPPNRLSMDWAWGTTISTASQAVIWTCVMEPDFSAVRKVLTKEFWCITSMGYSAEAVEVKLTNVIDAVDSNVPFIALTRERCGNLPVTGSIQNA